MRTSVVVVTAMVLGLALGLGRSWAQFGPVPAPDRTPRAEVIPPGVAPPKALVDQVSFVFGKIERGSEVEHAFRFTNVGGMPLKLENGGTSCGRCTVVDFERGVVEPGRSMEIVVRYDASADTPHFRQSATILTNDPQKPRIELSIEGDITASYRLVPASGRLNLSGVSVNETRTVELLVLAELIDNLQITDFELLSAESRLAFEVAITPLGTEALKQLDVKSGVRVAVTVKPGLPLGSLQQTIRLHTNLDTRPTLDVPVEGTVTSDITVAGQGWDSHRSVVVMGGVSSQRGAKRTMRLIVHGPYRHEVRFQVERVEPQFLKVTLGEPVTLNDGVVVHVPCTIEIPPGTPPANYLGSLPGNLAEIVLGTTHPQAKQLKMHVQFAVEKDGD